MNLTRSDSEGQTAWLPLPRAMSLLKLSPESVLSYVRVGRLQARLCGNRWWIKARGVYWLAKILEDQRSRKRVAA